MDDAFVCPDRNLRYTYRELKQAEKGCAGADGGRLREAALERYGLQTFVGGHSPDYSAREFPTLADTAHPVRASGCYHCVVLGDWGPACAGDRTEGALGWRLKVSERGG